MLVSVVVPIYNVEVYLPRCLDSILSQTYSNIEVILVNDGSQDESLQICNEYLKSDERIILIDQENKGLGGARNSGLKKAKGTYVVFIDPDDAIDCKMIFDFVNIAKANFIDVICANYRAYDAGNITYKIIRNDIKYEQIMLKVEIKKFFLEPYYGGYMGIIPSACTKFYRINFLTENNIYFDEKLRRAQDYWFNFYVFKMANTAYAIDNAYYHYYKNIGSMIRTYRPNVFEMYVANRQKLLYENRELQLDVNWPILNMRFTEDANEYALLCIKAKGFINSYRVINNILKNKEFQTSYSEIRPNLIHLKLIKKLLQFKIYLLIHLIYCTWSLKLE